MQEGGGRAAGTVKIQFEPNWKGHRWPLRASQLANPCILQYLVHLGLLAWHIMQYLVHASREFCSPLSCKIEVAAAKMRPLSHIHFKTPRLYCTILCAIRSLAQWLLQKCDPSHTLTSKPNAQFEVVLHNPMRNPGRPACGPSTPSHDSCALLSDCAPPESVLAP